MPLAVNNPDVGVQLAMGLRRNPLTQHLEIDLRLIEVQGGSATTVQEGTFQVGADQLYTRLQEHLNNYLRQATNRFNQLERTIR